MGDVAGPIIAGFKANRDRMKAESSAGYAEANLRDEERNRPIYHIASEYDRNQEVANANRAMYGRMTKTSEVPGQAQAEQKIEQGTASSLGAASRNGVSSPSMYAQLALQGIDSNNNQKTNLAIRGSEQRLANVDKYSTAGNDLIDVNKDMAEEKDKAFSYNVNDPYQNRVAKYRDQAKYYRTVENQKADQTTAAQVQGSSNSFAFGSSIMGAFSKI